MSDEPTTGGHAIPATDAPVSAASVPSDARIADVPSAVAPATPASAPAPVKVSHVVNPYIWGTGRRKTAVARVRVRPGDGKFVVNRRELDEYFRLDKDRQAVRTPLNVTETTKTMDVFVNVVGGGISGQAGAVVLGLSRALVKTNSDYEPKLREQNLLTRDARKVERKKYGQSGARKRFQFSKR